MIPQNINSFSFGNMHTFQNNLFLSSRIEEFKNSKSLHLSHISIDENINKQICDFINEYDLLENLNFSHCHVIENSLSALTNCLPYSQKLRSIKLINCNLHDHDFGIASFFNSLGKNLSLRELILTGNFLGYKAANYIANLLSENKGLELIDLRNNKFDNESGKIMTDALNFNFTIRSFLLADNLVDPFTLKKIEEIVNRNQHQNKINIMNTKHPYHYNENNFNLNSYQTNLSHSPIPGRPRDFEKARDVQIDSVGYLNEIEGANRRILDLEEENRKLHMQLKDCKSISVDVINDQNFNYAEEIKNLQSHLA